MKEFGGPAFFIDRSDINTDEIIPAKYLTEISKQALRSHLLEDLHLEGFDSQDDKFKQANVLVTRSNFGCGSSREHAVWVLEVNDINVVIAESFARIFRQNCFNCGILAIELGEDNLSILWNFQTNTRKCKSDASLIVGVDLEKEILLVNSSIAPLPKTIPHQFKFKLNPFDKKLVEAGGWLAYADQNY